MGALAELANKQHPVKRHDPSLYTPGPIKGEPIFTTKNFSSGFAGFLTDDPSSQFSQSPETNLTERVKVVTGIMGILQKLLGLLDMGKK